jgi:hypothetical protein
LRSLLCGITQLDLLLIEELSESTIAIGATLPETIKADSLLIVDGSRPNSPPAPCAISSTGDFNSTIGSFNINHQDMDDPFISPAPNCTIQTTNLHTPKQNVIGRNQANLTIPSGNGFSPRADRLGQQITTANAQAMLPPEALVFVAK